MRKLVTALFLSVALALSAQTERAAVTPLTPPSVVTRAVVVGISDYRDPAIPDLRFAHRDAQAFVAWLRSESGGALTGEHIQLLTDDKATAGSIIAALGWLVEESKRGDKAIFVFSGHGDVEQTTKSQWGYLLAHDAPPKVYPAGGALPVPYLQDIVSTLSEAGVQVFVISDACHAGKLAGSTRGGTTATTSALAQQFANEVKILSCQPEEFSLEGEQWGGGRGCFSYHLEDALYGFADADEDDRVDLFELRRYLEDRVGAEAAPHHQTPMVSGPGRTKMAGVRRSEVAARKTARGQGPAPFLATENKGMESFLLTDADSSVQQIYQAFIAALERGDLLEPAGASANDWYLHLLNEPKLARLHGAMTRNLAAALQDEAQKVINQLLATDPQIVDDAFSPVSRYDHLPAYLARAAELLGERHYMWRFLKAREYYFRSKTLRQANYPDVPADSLLFRQLACLDTALAYDPDAAYLYFEKGYLLHWGMQARFELLRSNFDRAVALAPEWVLPLYFLGRVFSYLPETKTEGIKFLKKVIELDSTFLPAYRNLGFANFGTQTGVFWFEEYIRRMRDYERSNPGRVPLTYYNYLGSSILLLGRPEEAKVVLLKGLELSNDQFPIFYANLGAAYIDLGQYEEADQAALKLIELSPLNPEGYLLLIVIRLYLSKKNMETAPGLCRRVIQLGRIDAYEDLIWFFQTFGQPDSALSAAREWIALSPEDPVVLYRVGQAFFKQRKIDAANSYFQQLLDNKTDGYDQIPAFFYRLIARIQLGREGEIPAYIASERLKVEDQAGFCFITACAFASCDRRTDALDWLEKALIAGWMPIPAGLIYTNLFSPDLDSIRDTKRFKKLVKRYLPEQAKLLRIK